MLPRPVGCDHVNGLIVILGDRGKPRMVRDIIRLNTPAIDLVTARAIGLEQEILAGAFLSSG